MRNISLLALAVSCGFGFHAQAQEIGRYDKSIEKAAAVKAGEKIGSLRGLILADDKEHFVTAKDLQPETKEEPSIYPAPFRKAWQPDPTTEALPPMVMVDEVDQIITGRSFKFDSEGNPMRNHQEYERPTPLSVAKSLFDAMRINPYPGDS